MLILHDILKFASNVHVYTIDVNLKILRGKRQATAQSIFLMDKKTSLNETFHGWFVNGGRDCLAVEMAKQLKT